MSKLFRGMKKVGKGVLIGFGVLIICGAIFGNKENEYKDMTPEQIKAVEDAKLKEKQYNDEKKAKEEEKAEEEKIKEEKKKEEEQKVKAEEEKRKKAEEEKKAKEEKAKKNKMTFIKVIERERDTILPTTIRANKQATMLCQTVINKEISPKEAYQEFSSIEEELLSTCLFTDKEISNAENEKTKNIMLQNNKMVKSYALGIKTVGEGVLNSNANTVTKGASLLKASVKHMKELERMIFE